MALVHAEQGRWRAAALHFVRSQPLSAPSYTVSAAMRPGNVKKKRRQHYVWRHYLEGWTRKGKLWCRQAGRVFPASVQNVAHERDFYRLREMTEWDLEIVRRLLIEPLPSAAREIAEGWIPYFTEFFRLKRLHEASGRPRPDVAALLEATIHNLEEDLHAHLEREAKPFLAALRAADQSLVLEDKLSTSNVWFIAAQYFRTPRMMKRVVTVLQRIPRFNAEASLGLIRTISTTNVGAALWMRRAGLRMTFLHASEGRALITGDQPIVNTRANGAESETPPR